MKRLAGLFFFLIVGLLVTNGVAITETYWDEDGTGTGLGGSNAVCDSTIPGGAPERCTFVCSLFGPGTIDGCAGGTAKTFLLPPNLAQIESVRIKRIYGDDWTDNIILNGASISGTAIPDHGCVLPNTNFPTPRYDRRDVDIDIKDLLVSGPNQIIMTAHDPAGCEVQTYAGVSILKREFENHASLDCSSVDAVVNAGELTIEADVENTGETDWEDRWDYRLEAQLFDADGSPIGSPFELSLNQVINDGETATIGPQTFPLPSDLPTGDYDLELQMIQRGYQPGFGNSCTETVNISTTSELPMGPSCTGFDFGNGNGVDHVTMVAGSTRTVSFSWINDTGETWTLWNGSTGYRIGSQDPRDNRIWNSGRVELTSPVLDGGTLSSSFDIQAPTTPGHYKARFAILEENDHWETPDTLCGPLDVNVVSPDLAIVNVHAVKNNNSLEDTAALFTVVVKNTGSTDLAVNTVVSASYITLWARLENESTFTPLGSIPLSGSTPFPKGSEQSFDLEVSDFSKFTDYTTVIEARLTTLENSTTGMPLSVSVPGLPAGEVAIEDIAGNDWRTFVFVKKGTTTVVDDQPPLIGTILVGLLVGSMLFMQGQKMR